MTAGAAPEAAEDRVSYRSGFVDGYDAAERAQREAARRHAADPAAKAGGDPPKDGPGPGGDPNRPKDGDKPEDAKRDGGKPDDPTDNEGKPTKPPIWKRPLLVLIGLVVLLALVIGGLLVWRHSRQHADTDDAFIDGQASRIAAQTSGRVVKLYVVYNQVVKAGDPLIEIDAADVQSRVDQARAQVATAESQVRQARTQVESQRAASLQAAAAVRQADAEAVKARQDLARYRRVDPDAIAGQQADAAVAAAKSADARLDQARANQRAAASQIRGAEAQVEVAKANVETAKASAQAAGLQLSYTHVVAPIAGRVTRRSVDVGNVIATGQALLAIVSDDLWVTANFKETQLTRMQVGQPVEVAVDAFPKLVFSAHVDSIQRGTGGFFSMLPAENATGNYVKVVQRVPVKIVFDRPAELKNYPIGPGMSVKPDVRFD